LSLCGKQIRTMGLWMSRSKKKSVSDKHLLKLWGEVVKLRAGNKCEYPNCHVQAKYLNPHHYYSKRNTSTRYDPKNGICLCSYHHTLGVEAAHKDPNFKDIIITSGVRSEDWHWDITERKNRVVKKNDAFFKDGWKATLEHYLEVEKNQ